MSVSSPPRGLDLDLLYRRLATRLEHIVRQDVEAPRAVIEDACQTAWSRLLSHTDRVCQESVLAWLARTAVHEAWRLLRRESRDLSLEHEQENQPEWAAHTVGLAVEEMVEARLRLSALNALSARQQRMVWLQGLGLRYEEIATVSGCSARTVERQLLRAKRAMRVW